MSATYALACGHTVVVPHGGSAKCEPCDALAQYVGALVKRSEVAESTTAAPIGPDGLAGDAAYDRLHGVDNHTQAEVACPECGGSMRFCEHMDDLFAAVPCPTCSHSEGYARLSGQCPTCKGEGQAPTATIGRVARPRGVLTEQQRMRLEALRIAADETQADYRAAVVRTLAQGASFSEVSKATGLSTNTLQRWKREAGK
jgi:uncharacterized protein YerC/ribosomal protein S27E